MPSPAVKSPPQSWTSPFLKACRQEPVPYTPIWIMRQAGRYLPEYRAVRERFSFLELCKHPDAAAEVTIQPVEILGVDAAILFSDILLIVEPLGFDLEFAKGEGPVIHNPVRRASDVDRLVPVEPRESLACVAEAVKRTRRALRPEIPLIGFAGAPYTLASYLVEGQGSRTCERTKAFMREQPKAWHGLLERLGNALSAYLNMQAEAGVQAVQLFDSWVGTLTPDEYARNVFPHSRDVFARLPKDLATIHFGTGTAPFLEQFAAAGSTVVGVDAAIPLDEARKRIGSAAIQGNLESRILLTDRRSIEAGAREVLDRAEGRPGHIFNLGHGILPEAPVDHVKFLVEFVHEYSKKHGGSK